MANEILVEITDHVAVMTLNRPERMNAWVGEMDLLLEEWMPRLANDPEVRVLVLTGAGKGFCSGADVEGWSGGKDPTAKDSAISRRKLTQSSTGLILPFREFPRPVIGAINGVAAGAGFALAMAADFRIGSDTARLSTMFIKRGLTPASGVTWLLPRALGPARALDLMLTGDWIEAPEAERLGLFNKVIPANQLLPVTLELARKIARMPPIAAELTKKAVWRGMQSDLVPHLDLETHYQKLCFGTEDFKESTQAFIEKREPRFKGR